LSDTRPVLCVSIGADAAVARSAWRGIAMGLVWILVHRGADLLDVVAGDPARGGVCARQRQPVALASLSVVAVLHPRAGGVRAGVALVLVDAPGRGQSRSADLRAVLPGS